MQIRNKKPKAAIFLHMQKTAGSTIVNIARQAYGSEQIISHGDCFVDIPRSSIGAMEQISRGGKSLAVLEEGAAKYRDFPFVSGHFGYNFAKSLMRERYSFVFLRDPIERILSFYYFCKSRDPKEYEIYALTQRLSFDDFLRLGLEEPTVQPCIWNNQAWQLAHGFEHPEGKSITDFSQDEILDLAIRHLDDFSHVGFAETFPQDRNHVLRSLGIRPPLSNIVINGNPGRPAINDLPSSTLDLLHELTQLDRVLYREAWSRRKPRSWRERIKLWLT